LLASLLILPLKACEPPRSAVTARAEHATSTAPVVADAPAAPAAPVSKPAAEKDNSAELAALEGKAPTSLSVSEILLVNDGKAKQKRADAQAFSRKLQEQPDLLKDRATQSQVMRLVADPDTAAIALGALAESRSPVGADLLHEAWTSRAFPPATAELARTLLFSKDVRPSASPGLAVALDLRDAETSCEAMQKALPKAQTHADARAFPVLGKLSSHRGCGPKKADDCYECLRDQPKLLAGAVNAAKRRKAPSYPLR